MNLLSSKKYAILDSGDFMINNIGCDIVSIKRLKNTIALNPAFLKKTYTPKELKLASTLKNPIYFYATRFAAKEAIFKASGARFEFRQIEILKNQDGSPSPVIKGQEDIKIKLSLSYEDKYAVAFCIVLS